MKHIPNCLSMLRILLCLPLIVLDPFGFWFLLLYTIAGITDMIDGPIARRTNTVTPFGANLDAAADLLFALIVFFRIIPELEIIPWMFAWILSIIALKFLSIFVSYIRHGELVLLHTYANKFTAFSLFLFPLLFVLMDLNLLLLILCIIASMAFFEELLINSSSKEPKRDVKGFFFTKNS